MAKKHLKKPICLFIDDVSPINLMHFHEPGKHHVKDIFPEFFDLFLKVCEEKNITGKISITPYPGGEVISSSISGGSFLDMLNSLNSSGKWDFSCEGRTHDKAEGFGCREDDYFDKASGEDIREYLRTTFEEIRRLTKISVNSVTSPWMSGIKNRDNFEQGILESLSIFKPDTSTFWYFLDISSGKRKFKPTKNLHHNGRDLWHLPATVDDYWWYNQFSAYPSSTDLEKVIPRIKFLMSLSENVCPLITVLVHWQSLFSNGSYRGLLSFVEFLDNLPSDKLEWVVPSSYLKVYEKV